MVLKTPQGNRWSITRGHDLSRSL